MLSHGNITHAALGMMVIGMEVGKVKAPPVWNTPEGIQVSLNVVPVYHTLGLYISIFYHFLRPSTIVMLPKWNPEVFFDSIPKYKITNLILVPSLVHQIVHHPRFKTADLSSVQEIGCGAAYLPSHLADQLRVRVPAMKRITVGYGLSEFTMGVTIRPVSGMLNGRAKDKHGSVGILLPGIEARIVRPDGSLAGPNETMSATIRPVSGVLNGRAKDKHGSVGILLPGVEARIIRPDGSLAGPNEVGEILLRGGTTALGYKGNDKATRETFVDGWVHTGDQMRIDEDGDTLKISGMQVSPVEIEDTLLAHPDKLIIDDTLKISGMQVSPVEIEDTLLAHPDKLIIDVTVAGVTGGRTSDERIPRAWVVLSPAGVALGGKDVVARLDVWVQERLSRYKWLRGGMGIVEAIPKSPTGKVLRRILVEQYEKEVNTKAKL
ncbi:hypothetical protein AZE42_03213 [Rhizopogon vesiculosus]|uniref:Uncharacterized protein n=1 Tax=Rhizopogon vesiculosus TaxID=180088 RepID=A0A1J8QEZ1_9AGAM|nr:hypothetical protein AZE42_03213 [Rhizopogon vesiculosus]